MNAPRQAEDAHHRHRDDQLPTHDHAHWLIPYPRHNFWRQSDLALADFAFEISFRKIRFPFPAGVGTDSFRFPLKQHRHQLLALAEFKISGILIGIDKAVNEKSLPHWKELQKLGIGARPGNPPSRNQKEAIFLTFPRMAIMRVGHSFVEAGNKEARRQGDRGQGTGENRGIRCGNGMKRFFCFPSLEDKKKKIRLGIGSIAMSFAISFSPAHADRKADRVTVLWYTYAHPASEYRQRIGQLSHVAHTLPQSNGVPWKLTFWDSSDPRPDFDEYDVLVIESGEAFLTGATDETPAKPDYRGILYNKAAIEAARGDRTFITAADADFHAIRGDTGNTGDADARAEKGRCIPAILGPDCWDGALGHVVNAINWAAGGNGLGVVSFLDGEHPGSFWWTHENSFLRSELVGHVDYAGWEQNPIIRPEQATHPLNSGLTSKGLSNWNKSFHAFFIPVEGYLAVVDSSLKPGAAVAIAKTCRKNDSRGPEASTNP